MTTITASPCLHQLDHAQCAKAIDPCRLIVRVDQSAQTVFTQINEQLDRRQMHCPVCERRIERIDPNPAETGRFPLSTAAFAKVRIEPLPVQLKKERGSDQLVDTSIYFKRVELANVRNEGKQSNDAGETYHRLAELANDFNGLVSMLGPFLGRALYWLPVSWKAGVYIRGMEENQRKGLAACEWVLSDQDGNTIGNVSLSKIDSSQFDLDAELRDLQLYNIGVLLHSDFQRRGVVTAITNHLYDQLGRLQTDMDGLWIKTRPDNTGVNHIAQKLNFTFIKQMDVQERGLLPCFSHTVVPYNLYVKRF